VLLRATERLENGEEVKVHPDLSDVRAEDVFLQVNRRSSWREVAPKHWIGDSTRSGSTGAGSAGAER
jgi:hypothetical protein